MVTEHDDYSKRSPDMMLEVFSKSRMLFYCLVAVGIHVAVMVVTSLGYIRDRWIDPEGAKDRAAQEAPAAEEKGRAAEPPAEAKVETTATNSQMVIDDTVIPDSATNSAIVKAITEVAQPDEIPDAPDLGINLDDTRRRE